MCCKIVRYQVKLEQHNSLILLRRQAMQPDRSGCCAEMGHRANNKWVGHIFFGLGPHGPGAGGMCRL